MNTNGLGPLKGCEEAFRILHALEEALAGASSACANRMLLDFTREILVRVAVQAGDLNKFAAALSASGLSLPGEVLLGTSDPRLAELARLYEAHMRAGQARQIPRLRP